MKIGFALWPATASGCVCRVLTAVLAAAEAARGFSQTTRGSTTRSTEIDFEAAAAENHERDAENREKTRPLQNREKTDLVKMQEEGASAAASQQQLQLLRRTEHGQSTATTLTETTTSNRQWCFKGNLDLHPLLGKSIDDAIETAGDHKLKSSKNGARCCGEKAVVEAATGGSWTTFPNQEGILSPDGQIDCANGSSCKAGQRVTYEEAVTACEGKNRRLCYVEELLMNRTDGKSLCSDVIPTSGCENNYIWSGGRRPAPAPAPETAPAPTPAPTPAPAPTPVVGANMADGGEEEETTTESTTTTGAAAEEQKDNTLLIAGAALALLVLAGGAVAMSKKGGGGGGSSDAAAAKGETGDGDEADGDEDDDDE